MNEQTVAMAKIIYQSHRDNTQIDLLNDRRLNGSQWAWANYAAQRLAAAGYRQDLKP